ncbi:hypothetical protein AB3X52_01040 [Nocardioides sp. DS6]|uniref:Mce-associated membrane protein n=1 Tax=Nocardioides eburneus TaxID=3231482 RepID=A0ABV3STB0_9ACTN
MNIPPTAAAASEEHSRMTEEHAEAQNQDDGRAGPTLTIVDRGEGAGPRRRHPLRLAALLLVACAVMVVGLVTWHRAAHDPTTDRAQMRDAVLIAATRHIETLNTLDYRHVDDGLAAWRAVTTGTLRDQLSGVDASERKLLGQQKTITKGRVVDAAVYSLDDDTATVIAAVEVTVTDASKPGKEPTVKRNRFSADLVRVHGRWLLDNLQQVAVNLS